MAEEANDVTTADVQATAPTDSSPVETKELEVVEDGEELNPNDFSDEEETEGEQAEESSTDEESTEQTDETESEEQPQEKPSKSENRFQKLANENRELKEYISKYINDNIQRYDVQKAVEEGTPELRAELDALKQQLTADRSVNELAELNATINSEADMVSRDFPYMDVENANRTPEEKQLAGELLDLWLSTSGVEMDPTNTFVTKAPKISLYQFVKRQDALLNMRTNSAKTEGRKSALKTLSAVETKPASKPRQTSSDDAKLSPEAYAKKYGLTRM